MKKLILCVSAILMLTACSTDSKETTKCTDVNELKEAITKGSTDTAMYDLNGDGEITIADVNVLVADSLKTDTIN